MANPSKAYLGQSTITYLGHELSPNGVTLSDDNVKPIHCDTEKLTFITETVRIIELFSKIY